MTFYHGSPFKGLHELKPFLSEHGEPYIYFASNPLVALLYAVKPVPKPFSFYPYGFGSNGIVIYSEYYENAFYDLYKGKTGFLYECDHLKNVNTPTQICCACTVSKPVRIDRVTEISDLYAFYKGQEAKGLFRIKNKNEISDKEIRFISAELKGDIIKNHLVWEPQHAMSIFIKTHFPEIWESVQKDITV